jgi:hypothetical protein
MLTTVPFHHSPRDVIISVETVQELEVDAFTKICLKGRGMKWGVGAWNGEMAIFLPLYRYYLF